MLTSVFQPIINIFKRFSQQILIAMIIFTCYYFYTDFRNKLNTGNNFGEGMENPENETGTKGRMEFKGNGCCRFDGFTAKMLGEWKTKDQCRDECEKDDACVAASYRGRRGNKYRCQHYNGDADKNFRLGCNTNDKNSGCWKKNVSPNPTVPSRNVVLSDINLSKFFSSLLGKGRCVNSKALDKAGELAKDD